MTILLEPGATIGILGGGQLGRMLALAAARLGLKCHIYDPAEGGPAMQVAAARTCAPFDDEAALTAFARACDVVTFEFENIPYTALNTIGAITPVRPGRRALEVSQDRLVEKGFLADLGIKTAPYHAISSPEDLAQAIAAIGAPGILKTRRFGYDGKGQVRVSDADVECQAIWTEIGEAPAIYEGFIDFDFEISAIAARGSDGAVAVYDPGRNLHEDGILRRTTVPAGIPAQLATDAALIAGKLLNALDYIGVLGLEFFVSDRQLIANEFAPRVHNSGHWTQNACAIDQFEQHIRAVAGWPLGPATRHSDAQMQNLIGDEVEAWRETDADGLHLYGKAEARPGRKMGHVNRITPRAENGRSR